jgi:hypothetical protein
MLSFLYKKPFVSDRKFDTASIKGTERRGNQSTESTGGSLALTNLYYIILLVITWKAKSCPFATFLKKFMSYSSVNDWVQRKEQYFAIWFNSGRFIIDIQQLHHGLSKVLKTSIFSQVVQLRSKNQTALYPQNNTLKVG